MFKYVAIDTRFIFSNYYLFCLLKIIASSFIEAMNKYTGNEISLFYLVTSYQIGEE